jgi:type IV secretory pathway VirJ component
MASAAASDVAGAAGRLAQPPAPRNSRPAPTSPDTASIAGLPLTEVPASGAGDAFAVLITGDGGWAAADKGLSGALAARGVSVVGLNSPRYLARARTPDETARDLERILRHYVAVWGRSRVVVIGYSRGADLAPFMVSRLPDDLRRGIALVALLGPSEWAGFQFHKIDLVANIHRAGDLPVVPEVGRLRGTPVLCIYGSGDHDSVCPSLDTTLVRPIRRDGGHQVGGQEGPALADTILQALSGPATP